MIKPGNPGFYETKRAAYQLGTVKNGKNTHFPPSLKMLHSVA